jgi:hypothetical protein
MGICRARPPPKHRSKQRPLCGASTCLGAMTPPTKVRSTLQASVREPPSNEGRATGGTSRSHVLAIHCILRLVLAFSESTSYWTPTDHPSTLPHLYKQPTSRLMPRVNPRHDWHRRWWIPRRSDGEGQAALLLSPEVLHRIEPDHGGRHHRLAQSGFGPSLRLYVAAPPVGRTIHSQASDVAPRASVLIDRHPNADRTWPRT